jgi:hypothetical protein
MKTGLHELTERREALVAQSAAQRARLAQAVEGVQRGFLVGRLALDAWRIFRSQPLVAALAVGVVLGARPRRLLAWASTGLTVYSVARRIAAALRARRPAR